MRPYLTTKRRELVIRLSEVPRQESYGQSRSGLAKLKQVFKKKKNKGRYERDCRYATKKYQALMDCLRDAY
jgi:hypothetical protein